MPLKNDEVSSLSHTKWDCKYHIVFTPKYRRKAIYAKLRADIGKYIRRCCMYKGVDQASLEVGLLLEFRVLEVMQFRVSEGGVEEIVRD